jgi:hypothetical protein
LAARPEGIVNGFEYLVKDDEPTGDGVVGGEHVPNAEAVAALIAHNTIVGDLG